MGLFLRKSESIIFIIIIIIIKKGRQCKAEREWYTLYQFKDPAQNTNL